jgi:hypothetical protein
MTGVPPTFTATELERMLDWYRALPLCYEVDPRDDELADQVAVEIAKLRTRSAGRPRR